MSPGEVPAPPADTDALYHVAVEFGDCDSVGIVHYPQLHRWVDAASRHDFVRRGVPHWRETATLWGVIGTPIVGSSTRFLKTAAYGDRLVIETDVVEWRRTSFVRRHRVRRGADLLVEGHETRVFAARGDAPATIRTVEAAPIRTICGG